MTQFGVRIQMVREANPGYKSDTPLRNPFDAMNAVKDMYAGLDREMVSAIALSTKHHINARYVVSIGHLSGSPVHPREVFKAAILANAHAVILVHNHPSGELTPSGDDIAITRRLVDAGEILGIKVLDHIIVDDTAESCISLKESGYWPT